MSYRKDERLAWLLGWTGAFLWVLVLASVKLAQGRLATGLIGFLLFLAGIGTAMSFSPWRHSSQRYWRLMIPAYIAFFIALGWVVSLAGGFAPLGLNKWALLFLLPLLLPFATAGQRRWTDVSLPTDSSER
jgi:hypothetical protein